MCYRYVGLHPQNVFVREIDRKTEDEEAYLFRIRIKFCFHLMKINDFAT